MYLAMKYPEEVSVGSLYTVYRRSRKVFHPANGRYLGNLISIVGVVQVTKVDNDLATVRVERGYLWAAPGDLVMPFSAPVDEPSRPEPNAVEAAGMIIEIQTPRTLVANNNIVYLDLGRADGLRAGDRLHVLRSRRGFPTEPIGEVKVLAAEDTTATALIVWAIKPLMIGDPVVPKVASDEAATRNPGLMNLRSIPVTPSAKARETLTKSLQAEIARGDVSVEQVGDKVTISLNDLVDQLEYAPGEARIKPTGMHILKQISTYLKQDTENEILVEGHTDNQRIGPSLLKHYPSNQELSEARASLIVRYFIDAGIEAALLTAIGYADTRPVADNGSENGRRRNRRIEIVLTPKQGEVPGAQATSPALPPAGAPIGSSAAEGETLEPLHVNTPPHPDTAAAQEVSSSEPASRLSN